jgi:hypothetical protein
MNEPTIFTLEPSELQNPLWVKLSKRFEQRLAELRLKNEADIGEVETANLRGRIAELKALLALASPRNLPPT